MARWRDALRAYQRRPLTSPPDDEPSTVMFVLCSESHAATELVDEPEGDAYACDVAGKRATLLDDQDLATMLGSFARQAS